MVRGDLASWGTTVVLPAVLIAAMLGLNQWTSRERSENRRLIDSRQYPVLIAGLRPPLDSDVIEWVGPPAREAPRAILSLAVSDQCSVCRVVEADVASFLRSIEWRPGLALWIIDFAGGDMGIRLANQAGPGSRGARVMSPRDSVIWTARTGVVATPSLLVLDARGRVRLRLTGATDLGSAELLLDVRRELAGLVDGHNDVSAGTPTLTRGGGA